MKSKGFTLIELLISFFIFSLIVGLLGNIFIFNVRLQQKSLAWERMIESLSYNLEYMSRHLRLAKKDLTGSCIPIKTNYSNDGLNSKIKFLDMYGNCVEFYLLGGRIYKGDVGNSVYLPISSRDIRINALKFIITGEKQEEPNPFPPPDSLPDLFQPKVTIVLEAESKGMKINLQTTVSQRALDYKI